MTRATEPFRLIGVLHLPALPGTATHDGGWPIDRIAEVAAEDAHVLERAGFSDVMIQNANDVPQSTLADAAIVASMTRVGSEVAATTDLAIGITVSHNDGPSAMGVAAAIGARFIRVKLLTGTAVGPAGILHGCAVETVNLRHRLGADVEIWADVFETTSHRLAGTRESVARELVQFGGADRLIVTRDGSVDDALQDIAELRATVPDTSMIIGGRATVDSIERVRAGSEGAIIGGAIQSNSRDSARISPDQAAAIVHALDGPPAGLVASPRRLGHGPIDVDCSTAPQS